MSKKIVAIGGGENGREKNGVNLPYETGPIDQEIIRLTGKQHPNFLLLAHAQPLECQEIYFSNMKNIYNGKYGCECKDLKSDKLIDKEFVQSLIDWADIIYEGGGNTVNMINLWKNTGFNEVLKKARDKGKVMCGLSAGANCRFKKCASAAGKDNDLMILDCLGFVDGLFVPHADELNRQEKVKKLLNENQNEIGLLLSNCAALEIVDNQYRVIKSDASNHPAKIAYGKKAYQNNGEFIIEDIETDDFKKLSELYSRL